MHAWSSGSSGRVPSARIHSLWIGSLLALRLNGSSPMWRWSMGWGLANQSVSASR